MTTRIACSIVAAFTSAAGVTELMDGSLTIAIILLGTATGFIALAFVPDDKDDRWLP